MAFLNVWFFKVVFGFIGVFLLSKAVCEDSTLQYTPIHYSTLPYTITWTVQSALRTLSLSSSFNCLKSFPDHFYIRERTGQLYFKLMSQQQCSCPSRTKMSDRWWQRNSKQYFVRCVGAVYARFCVRNQPMRIGQCHRISWTCATFLLWLLANDVILLPLGYCWFEDLSCLLVSLPFCYICVLLLKSSPNKSQNFTSTLCWPDDGSRCVETCRYFVEIGILFLQLI